MANSSGFVTLQEMNEDDNNQDIVAHDLSEMEITMSALDTLPLANKKWPTSSDNPRWESPSPPRSGPKKTIYGQPKER